MMLAFGREHPYGRPVQGLPGSVAAIHREDLAAFWGSRWKPGSSALVFAGDISLAQATALAERVFGGWAGGAPAPVAIPTPSPAPPDRIYLVDRQDAAQTVVSQFLPAPRRDSPDYFALEVVNGVWGGSAGSRLGMNLREEKGYSYGIFSGIFSTREASLWVANGGVQTNKTKESIAEFDKEMRGIAGGKPITQEEFDGQRARIIRGYAQQFESLSPIVGQVAQLWTEGLPMAELQREYDEISKVTLEGARAAAVKHARPERAALLLVGDRAKVEAGLNELKLGAIVFLDAEGKPVTAQ
jgi:zinc protease